MVDKLSDWRRTHYSQDISPYLDGQHVTLFGWVHELRDLGGIVFIILRDRAGKVQVVLPRDKVGKHVLEKALSVRKEDVIAVRGLVRKMPKAPGGAEILPSDIKILNRAAQPIPLDMDSRIPAELDVRLNLRVLDLRRKENFAIFSLNDRVLRATRAFLSAKGFIEIQTPKIISSATEGGAALFPVSYYGKEAFLAQSPQLYKEQLVSVFEKVYEIGPIFRAEEFNTTRHLSEVVSVDIEEAFVDMRDVMQLLEDLICHIYSEILDSEELKILNRELKAPRKPFRRLSYDDAVRELKENNVEVNWGEDFSTQALRVLGDLYKEFLFITDWPTRSKPFYIKPRDDRPEVCESFDLMYGHLELASGGTRIHVKEQLLRRLEEQGLNPKSFEHHLAVFDYGMPPHAGWGLGLARLLMVITGRRNIREVVLYPRDKNRLVP